MGADTNRRKPAPKGDVLLRSPTEDYIPKPDVSYERDRVVLFDSREQPLVRAIGYHPALRRTR